MIPKIIITLLIASPLLHAEPRAWRSADGTRSIQGEFLKRDAARVTIRRPDQKQVIISLDKLHADDRAWLDENHPFPGAEAPPPAVFDQLQFGDQRAEVIEKLKTSQIVELTLPETFLARTGLNNVFRTRKKIGGLDATLSFDWADDGGLKEITLHTAAFPAGKFDEQLQPCWQDFIKLLTSLNGQPINASDKLELATIPDAGMYATHLWKLHDRGTAMLGAAREGDEYLVAVRFTIEDIKPVIIPKAASR